MDSCPSVMLFPGRGGRSSGGNSSSVFLTRPSQVCLLKGERHMTIHRNPNSPLLTEPEGDRSLVSAHHTCQVTLAQPFLCCGFISKMNLIMIEPPGSPKLL